MLRHTQRLDKMDVLQSYFREISKIPLLTVEGELSLARRAVKGNKEATQKLIRSNLRLVVKIAKKYACFGIPLVDTIEEGNLGLIKAVGKFRPEKGYRFSTYASWWIKQYVVRAIANQAGTVRIPVYMAELAAKWKKTSENLRKKLEREPELEEIATALKFSRTKAKKIRKTVEKRESSLDISLGDSETATFADILEDEQKQSSKAKMFDALEKEALLELLDTMEEKERDVIKYRFGLKDGTAYTLEDTGKRLHLTRERIRQIQNEALKKLRCMLEEEEAG